MFRNLFSSSTSKLSLEEAMKLVNGRLEMARNESDPQKALQLAGEAESKIQEAQNIFATERVGSPALDEGIATAYHEHGKLLDKLLSHDKAQESYNNANKWGYIHVISYQSYSSQPDDMASSNRRSINGFTVLTAISSVFTATPGQGTIQSTHNDFTQEVLPSNIFDRDTTPPAVKYTLPGIGDHISSTPQLAYCLRLLQSSPASKEGFDETEREWTRTTTKDPDEQIRLQEISTDLIRAFVQDEHRSLDSINEIVRLAPVLDREDFRKLLWAFVDGIDNSRSLDINMVDGLVHLMRNSGPRDFNVNDLVKILDLINTRLQDIHDQSIQQIYKLTLVVSGVFDNTTDSNVKELSPEQLHDPLFKYLENLQLRSDPYLMYQAAYTFQALQYVLDDESHAQYVVDDESHSQYVVQCDVMDLLQGAMSATNWAKSLDFNNLMEGLKHIHQATTEVTKPFSFNMKTNSGIGRNLRRNLKDGFSFRRDWYPALRALDTMLKDGQLSRFRMLICKAPCRLEPVFQLGVCQRLGELAINPAWDAVSRQSAVDFLGEIYKNDVQWGHHDSVKRWILHILNQLRGVPESAIHEKVQILFQELETNGGDKKQLLYQECAMDLSSSYPLMIGLSSETSPLLDYLSSVEAAISRLRRQRLMGQEEEPYITPRAKRNLHAKETFDLTLDVQEFLESNKKVFLLLGDSGIGKSTFNRALETKLWKAYHRDTNKNIPVFIHLPSITNPEQDMIAKQLRKLNFTEEQIRELKSQRKIILICDGYDECQQATNLYNSNQLNQPGGWIVQMMISCRTECIGVDYEDQFQPTDQNNCRASNLFQEAVIVPFNKDQTQGYIDQYVSTSKSITKNWGAKDFKKALEDIPNLQELLTNPFLLKMAMKVLPQLVDLKENFSSQKISRLALYDMFVAKWIERNKLRLMVTFQTLRDVEALKTLTASGFTEHSINYLKELVTCVYHNQGGNPVIDHPIHHDQKTWKESFFSDTEGKNLLQEAIPIVRDGNQYRFIHKSVLEYGLALAIYDPNEQYQVWELMPALLRSLKSLSSRRRVSAAEEQALLDSPLGRRNLVGEQPILQFLAERAQQEPVFKDRLHSLIERSKFDKTVGIAAANAITILVRAGVQFNGADLRNIKIQGADLSFGVFDSAQFEGADLWKVNLRNTWMRQANLRGARMTGTQFGELPFLQEDSIVYCCAYSPDGKTLAVGLANGNISLYETSSWDQIQTLKGHNNRINSISFSVTSNRIASGSTDKTVRLWDVDTGECVHTLQGHNDWVRSIIYSPRGYQIASGSDDKTVRLWDTDTGECIHTLQGHSDYVLSVAYSPKGNQIASGSKDSTVQLWDVDIGECLRVLQGHSDNVNSVTYSPERDWIASGSSDKTVRLWDVNTGECVHILQGHSDYVSSVMYSPKGDRIVSGSYDKTARLWDVGTGECVHTSQGHSDYVLSVAYSPKGNHIASGGYDKTVRLWDFHGLGECIHTSHGHGRRVRRVTYSPKGDRIASGSFDSTVRLWDVRTGECVNTLKGHSNWVNAIAYSPGGDQIASGSSDNTVRLWGVDTCRCVNVLKGHVGRVNSIAYSPKGDRIASGSSDSTVRLWNVDAGECVHILKGHSKWVNTIAYSPKGDRIASGSSDNTVRLWDVDSSECTHILEGHINRVNSIAYSPKGDRVASGSSDSTVRLWDADTGQCVHVLKGHGDYVRIVVYSPKGDQVASGSDDKTVRLWNIDTGECTHALQGHTGNILDVAFSSKGNWIASGSRDRTVRLWDVVTGEHFTTISGFSNPVNSIAWGNGLDAQYLATGCKSVCHWRITKEKVELKAVLCWGSSHEVLTVNGLSFENVQGLSRPNQKLLMQRGALISTTLPSEL